MEQRLHKSLRLAATLLVALSASTVWGYSFPIDLTFAGRGEATKVDKVTVTNLTQPGLAPVTLNGTDILRLVDPNDPDAIESTEELQVISQPILTPNPSFGDGTLIFDAKSDGPVRVSVYTTGGMLLDAATLNVSKGRNTARIPAQATGIYIVNIDGQGVKSSTRWICSGSKSFSGIALGGAAQWADVTLPTKTVAKAPQKRANTSNVVILDYFDGDILRLEGTSGKMTTIMHFSPTNSFDCYFDFFRCQDKNGYNYPILRSGEMLWMLEDLRPQTMTGVLQTSDAAIWKNVSAAAPAQFLSGGKAYYNIQAAREALPEGWRMPSIDEVYAYVKELKANPSVLGDFLKDRDYNWKGSLTAGPDTIHMLLQPNGYIEQDGKLTKNTNTGAWLTRNTINHGCPVSFEVSADSSGFAPQVNHALGCGFAVRGCRIAPSVYQEMIQRRFSQAAEARAFKASESESSTTPLGAYFSYAPTNRKAVFMDYSFNQYNTSTLENRSGILGDFSGNGSTFISKGMIPNDVNGADPIAHLRKVAPQPNAEGCDNLVYATWSRPFQVYTDGKKLTTSSSVRGEGVVYISIFGDASKNHKMLDGYNRRPLLDANGNEYIWEMNHFPVYVEESYSTRLSDALYEGAARLFNLKCIQDQNGDGLGEIVMQVGYKMAIFDGATLRCIREYKPSYKQSQLFRFDVADVDCDGAEDIVLISLTASGSKRKFLNIFLKGLIDKEPAYSIFIPRIDEGSPSSDFYDVKVGNFSGHAYPDIAVIERSCGTAGLFSKNGMLSLYRLDHEFDEEAGDYKKEVSLIKYFEQEVNVFASTDALRRHTGNMNLCFCYFRGRQYPADLIVGNAIWRYNYDNEKPQFLRAGLESTGQDFKTVPADAIAAVRLHEDSDKETLIFAEDYYANYNNYTFTVTSMGEFYLDNKGNFQYSLYLNDQYLGFGKNSPYYNNWKNPEMTKNANVRGGVEYASNTVLCVFNDREPVKNFKFVSREVSMSEPRIYAVLAAAPYYKDLGTPGETCWGKAFSTGTSTSKSDTWGGSVIVGYEYDFSIPFLAKGGVDFTTKVSASATTSIGHEVTTTWGEDHMTEEDHAVVMQAQFYDTYTYEITGSSDPDDIGLTIQVSAPRNREFVGVTLDDYVKLVGYQSGVARPQDCITSKPGFPFTYPTSADNLPGAIYNSDVYPFLIGRNIQNQEVPQVTGGTTVNRSMSLASSNSKTTSVEIGVETELVATVNNVKAGVGFNYNHSDETTHTVGSELSVGGTVPAQKVISDKYPTYRWNLLWYYVKDSNSGEIYPIVNYTVTR